MRRRATCSWSMPTAFARAGMATFPVRDARSYATSSAASSEGVHGRSFPGQTCSISTRTSGVVLVSTRGCGFGRGASCVGAAGGATAGGGLGAGCAPACVEGGAVALGAWRGQSWWRDPSSVRGLLSPAWFVVRERRNIAISPAIAAAITNPIARRSLSPDMPGSLTSPPAASSTRMSIGVRERHGHPITCLPGAKMRWQRPGPPSMSGHRAMFTSGSRVAASGTWPAARQPSSIERGAPGEEPA